MKRLLQQLAFIIVSLSAAYTSSAVEPIDDSVLVAGKEQQNPSKFVSSTNNQTFDFPQSAPSQVIMADAPNPNVAEKDTPCCGNAYYCKSCCEGETSCNPDYRRKYYPSCKEFWWPSYSTLLKSDNDSFICLYRPAYGCMPNTWACFCYALCTQYNRRLLW
jgi:hypothetical protein